MASLNEQLSSLPAFADLKPDKLEVLANKMDVLTLQTDERVFEQGSEPTGLYVLHSGSVILLRQAGGKSQALAILYHGDCFGGESLTTGKPSPYTAKALTPSEVFYLFPASLQALIDEHDELLVILLRLVSKRLRQLTTLVHDLAFRDVAARLAGTLLTLAEAQRESSVALLQVRRDFSQQDLAAMVGTAREVVYRHLKRFEADGLIEKTTQYYVILDAERLAAIATEEAR